MTNGAPLPVPTSKEKSKVEEFGFFILFQNCCLGDIRFRLGTSEPFALQMPPGIRLEKNGEKHLGVLWVSNYLPHGMLAGTWKREKERTKKQLKPLAHSIPPSIQPPVAIGYLLTYLLDGKNSNSQYAKLLNKSHG